MAQKSGVFKYEMNRVLIGILGVAIYSFGMNFFIVPLGLYSGGVLGVCQLIRTFATSVLGINFHGFDIAGILNYAMNIPLIYLAHKMMPRVFVIKLIIILTAMTFCLSIIGIPQQPLVDEKLTNCLIGSIICGFGIGTYLRSGCSGGGTEIIGIYFIRKKPNFSIGQVNMCINAVIYFVCLLLFNVSVAIYSIIYSVVSSLVMDKVHSQNINVEAIIISKTNNSQIEEQVMKELNRGITYWEAFGGYTGDKTYVMYTVLSKYEVATLRRIVHSANPNAFMVVKEGLTVNGNFIKRLS